LPCAREFAHGKIEVSGSASHLTLGKKILFLFFFIQTFLLSTQI